MNFKRLCPLIALLFVGAFAIAQSSQPVALASSTQLILVTTHDWSTVEASLQRYERANTSEKWRAVGAPVAVNLGRGGMGWGLGVAEIPATRADSDPIKKEGDGKSPAGIFTLSSAFGYAATAEAGWKMPYLTLTPTIECVDDVNSKYYGRVLDRSTVSADWKSSEKMSSAGVDYQIGLIISHNANPIVRGGGSCVFMHVWEGRGVPTSGCTAMPREQLEPIIAWLDPAKNPVLVQLPIEQYTKLKKSWKLPEVTVARWSAEQANAWYAKQPWLVGADYLPSDAINQLEMFQAATWNPALNDRELGLAESIGMNTMRVFLQDQLWQQDAEGFKKRLDEFLAIAAKHHIRPILVLFDSCWDPIPHLGPQHAPVPGVHNSGWVQSPGTKELTDPAYEPELEAYVKGIVGAFGNDPRVLAWDIWNEPDSPDENYGKSIPKNHVALVDALLPKVFEWARSVNPTQPLTSGVWDGNWADASKRNATTNIQLTESDVISFHDYSKPEKFEARVKELLPLGRPLICTEYMARGNGSTFETILPIAKKYHVAAINWGLVAGKMQTWLPWDSWEHPYVTTQPKVWHHDIFHTDGTPYSPQEVDFIRAITNRGN